jgi:hypothetical protein
MFVRCASLLLLLSLSGCSFVGSQPMYVNCKGRGSIEGQATLSLAYGAVNTFKLQADCGDEGFQYEQGRARLMPR